MAMRWTSTMYLASCPMDSIELSTLLYLLQSLCLKNAQTHPRLTQSPLHLAYNRSSKVGPTGTGEFRSVQQSCLYSHPPILGLRTRHLYHITMCQRKGTLSYKTSHWIV